jgi:lipoprotein NlpD
VSKVTNRKVTKRYDGFTAWQWPTKGNVSRRYSSKSSALHKGVDIRGTRGQSIFAANTGTVVYAGAGLPAYGKLLIVKHNDTYLSAYAHNRQLLVDEGDKVKVGQKIAEMGKSGTTYEHLHFEIRKKGVPINPLTILPKR